MDNEKLRIVFERADAVLSAYIHTKTDGKADLSKCCRGYKGTPVYADQLMGRCNRNGFYCWVELDGKDYGASCDDLGVLLPEEYEEILNMFRERYPVASL